MLAERVEIVLLARLSLPSKTAPSAAQLAKLTQRFRPTTMTEAQWRELVAETAQRLTAVAHHDELARRIGAHGVKKWEQWTDKLLPALGLGIALGDTRALRKLSQVDGWMAAIAGRSLGLWNHGPPSVRELCDALVWRELGLSGAPETCPPGLRAHFLRKYIAVTEGSPARLIRQLAARAVGAPRLELAAIRDSVVRAWLVGRAPGEPPARDDDALPARDAAAHPARDDAAAPPARDDAALLAATRDVVQHATDGVFGDRKVFISAAWQQLRARPAWSALALDDFKAALLAAHRRQELELVRADLISAMDPALVVASELQADGARFHFILREPQR